MATMVQQHAVDRIIEAVNKAQPDDLAEIHNELFPQTPVSEDEALERPEAIVEKIIDHIRAGLEMEEVLDLWNVIFPSGRRVWYDEVDGLIHYESRTDPVGQTD